MLEERTCPTLRPDPAGLETLETVKGIVRDVVAPHADEVDAGARPAGVADRPGPGCSAGSLRLYPAERLFLNPDCGFATFSNRPVNRAEVATEKMRAVVEAARSLRGQAVRR